MIKKTAALLSILIAAVCILAACGSKENEPASTTAKTQESTTESTSETVSGYTFTYKGVKIGIGQDASVIDQLGDYKSCVETKSCVFQGMDSQYSFGSFVITTGGDDSGTVVTGFWFSDDTVATDEGIAIGDSSEKVEAAYGADSFNGTNAYILEKDKCRLNIIMNSDGDSVKEISYTYLN